MPTGYTHSIKDGISFEKFTLNCARAFGALISMREEPNDAPIPEEIKPSKHYMESLKKAKADLKRHESMSLSQADKECQNYYDKEVKRIEEANLSDIKTRVAYEAMLSKVNKWTPPTPEHQGLKDFMVQQITDSIKWDCENDRIPPNKQKAEDWLLERKKSAMNDIEYYRNKNAEEYERCADRTKWIQDLFKSLK
jgi:hypothetical protein